MDAKLLRTGMKIKNGESIVEVTHVPPLDRYEECFFSGKVIESTSNHYKDRIGETFRDNWNSAFSQPV